MIIVFYDGDCGLCQRSIATLARIDKKNKFNFAPLNGKTYLMIHGGKLANLASVVLYVDGKSFEKSSAFFEICRRLGGWYYLFLVFAIFPKSLCNFVYDRVASRRQSIACVNIVKNEKFLD